MKTNRFFLYSTLAIMFFLPTISIVINLRFSHDGTSLILLIGKWFIFWAIGIRLLTAGLNQILRPGFTAESIFHLKNKESSAIIRELGFANTCSGLAAMISIFIPEWRIPTAFIGGLFLGIAGFQHVVRKPDNPNEMIPMISNLFIFLIMATYLIYCAII